MESPTSPRAILTLEPEGTGLLSEQKTWPVSRRPFSTVRSPASAERLIAGTAIVEGHRADSVEPFHGAASVVIVIGFQVVDDELSVGVGDGFGITDIVFDLAIFLLHLHGEIRHALAILDDSSSHCGALRQVTVISFT